LGHAAALRSTPSVPHSAPHTLVRAYGGFRSAEVRIRSSNRERQATIFGARSIDKHPRAAALIRHRRRNAAAACACWPPPGETGGWTEAGPPHPAGPTTLSIEHRNDCAVGPTCQPVYELLRNSGCVARSYQSGRVPQRTHAPFRANTGLFDRVSVWADKQNVVTTRPAIDGPAFGQ
jgi:hypothetical protein